MTSAAALFGEIFEITRGDLENASFPFVSAADYIRGMTSVRLVRMAEFWKNGNSVDLVGLFQSTEDFVGGLFGQGCTWSFFLRGLPSEIQCWFATDPRFVDCTSLESLLRSNFGDVRFGSASVDVRSFESLRHAVVVTGTPTPSQRTRPDSQQRREQLEKLCRGLFGASWLYVVAASPHEPAETTRSINELSERVKEVRANYLLKTSPIDEENRTAQRYVELLEAKLKRFERGRLSGMWDTRCCLFTDQPALIPRARHFLQAAFSGEDSLPDPVRVRPSNPQTQQGPRVEPLTTSEVAALIRLPQEDFPGFELVEHARFGVEPPRLEMDQPVKIGEIVDRGSITGNWLSVSRDDLTKHGLVVGITGSGKTNSCFWLLDQVWDGGKGVPFLVVESAKSEYRALAGEQRFRGVRLFTVGDDTILPLRLNPFEVPKGILVQTHIDYLKSLFSAAFVLYPPMPYVLEQSIQEIYEDRGWDVARNTNSRGIESTRAYPNLSDLAAKIPAVVDRMGYEQRIAMDVKAGLLARINQLRLGGGKGTMFDTRRSVSDSVLFESPCILELKQIVSDDEKAFIIGLVLIRLYEYHEARQRSVSGLIHLTLIEEAHRLLRNVSTEQGGEVSANPKGRAIEVFANILSEIRAFGEGILVAEQIPVKLTPDVVKNSGLKLIHRLVSPDDRELMGKAVNLTDAQVRHLATLTTGEAVAWTEHTRKAVLIRVPLSDRKNDRVVSNDEMRSASPGGVQTEPAALLPYEACKSCPVPSPRGCASIPREWDRPLLDSFRRVFNALRLSTPATASAFAEFRQLTQRGARSGALAPPFCSFVAIAENDIERRGEFRSWPYRDVEWMIASACSMARILNDVHDGLASIPPDMIQDFQSRCRQLETVDALPYPGCRMCDSPCQFRFDMAQAGPALGKEFQRAFLDTSLKADRLIEIARNAAAKSFFVSDRDSMMGASFCFAVQQLADSDLSVAMYYQHEVAGMMKRRLAARK
jgi:DNA helicase HerA-like ATPase